jgi:uncharacterized oxidoreductase
LTAYAKYYLGNLFAFVKEKNAMQMTGNTILITGGGSGIGRALAEAFHAKGNKVIIAGRRKALLQEVAQANPGMAVAELDIADAASLPAFAKSLAKSYPSLNVVIHNAGIMQGENLKNEPENLAVIEATVTTNILGPMRLTAAMLPHLMEQKDATIMTVSSGLAFVPLAFTPTYSASKTAMHFWSEAIRQQLKDTSVKVIELAPPYVQTELMGKQQASDPNAMPLNEFIAEVMTILEADPDTTEVIVERCKALRNAEATGNYKKMFDMLNSHFH